MEPFNLEIPLSSLHALLKSITSNLEPKYNARFTSIIQAVQPMTINPNNDNDTNMDAEAEDSEEYNTTSNSEESSTEEELSTTTSSEDDPNDSPKPGKKSPRKTTKKNDSATKRAQIDERY